MKDLCEMTVNTFPCGWISNHFGVHFKRKADQALLVETRSITV